MRDETPKNQLGLGGKTKHHQTSFIKFYPTPVVGFKLGDIITEDIADGSRCTLEGLDQTFQAGLETNFILFPKITLRRHK